MIFVATGTQFPFDRLVWYVDTWAAEHGEEVVAQIGEGEYLPQAAVWDRFVALDAYEELIARAEVCVSHAGMGNIVTARDIGTPIIVVNRQASLGEHRNDHQTEGLVWMGKLDGVYTASTIEELHRLLDERATLKAPGEAPCDRLDGLVDFLDAFIAG